MRTAGSHRGGKALSLLAAVICLLSCGPLSAGEMDEDFNYKLLEELRAACGKWVRTRSAEDKEACAKAAIRLADESRGGNVEALFNAAGALRMLGEYEEAIRPLDIAIAKYPMERAPGYGEKSYVYILANVWRASIFREAGEFKKAIKAYEAIIDDPRNEGLEIFLELYLVYIAEIQSLIFKDNKKAVATLERIKNIPCPPDEESAKMHAYFLDWADYEINRIQKGNAEAQKLMRGSHDKAERSLFMGMVILDISGFCWVQELRVGWDAYKPILEEMIQRSNSEINRKCHLLVLGYGASRKSDYLKAAEYYATVFVGDSFLAPDAGIAAWKSLRRQDKFKEKEEGLKAELIERFPGYRELVARYESEKR